MDPTAFDLEPHLQRHGTSLRRLAQGLVHERSAVDDALQETWLRALQQPPRHEAQIGGWLATILRHVVGRTRRGAQRRVRREQEVVRGPGDDDHIEVLARAEIVQRLLTAVRELDEPYRATIWRRYFEELPPTAIAVRDGVPLATVKSRLQRGLQQLRERLGEGGESSDWRGGLALAFGFEVPKGAAAAGTVAIWQGGLLMAAWTKVVAAAAVAGILAAWWWWPREIAQPSGAHGASHAVAAAPAVAAHEPSMQREQAAPPVAAPVAVPDEPEVRTVHVRGRVVDADSNEALPDVQVTIDDSGKVRPENPVAACATTTDGRFEVACDAGRMPRLWFLHAEHAAVWSRIAGLEAGQVEDLGDVPLPRGRRMTGRVVDVRGDPLPVAVVVNAGWSGARGSVWQEAGSSSARTRDDGSFVFEDPVRLGSVTFSAYSADYEALDVRRVEVAAQTPGEVVLVMRERPQITGVVVDADGQPLAGVGLSSLPSIVDTRSADDGSFRLVKRYTNDLTSTQVHVTEAPDFTPPPAIEVAWGTNGLRIVLQPAGTLPLEVVDRAGAPVVAFGVALSRPGLEFGEAPAVRHRGVHDDGRLLVERVVPGQTTLRVLPSDPMLVPGDPLPVTSLAPMRVELERRVPCVVEVRAAGRPVAGAHVELVRDNGRYACWYGLRKPPGMPTPRIDLTTVERLGEYAERVAGGTTAADGIVQLARDPVAAGCTLLVQAVGRPVHWVFEPVFPPDGRPLRVELTQYGQITGHVGLRDRRRFDVQVAFRCGELGEMALPQPDGSYRSPQLPVGSWQVSLLFGEGTVKQAMPQSAQEVQVLPDTVAAVDFDLADFVMARVQGAVAGVLGDRRLAVDFVRVDGAAPAVLANAIVGDGGTFGPVDLVPGTYRIALRNVEANAADVIGIAADTFPVAAGEARWLDVPAPRRLVVNLRRPDGSVVRGEGVVARCGGLQFPSFTMFMRTVDERLVLDPAPALPVEFRNAAHTAPWSTPVVMPPDHTEAEVTVVLPDPPR